MKQVCDYTQCTACSACINKCPKHCITYKENTIGHFIPVIDQNECIDCGACIAVCQVNKPLHLQTPLNIIGAYAVDKETQQSSSSGGIAAVLSKYIITLNGAVYGCAFEKPFQVKHIRITNQEDLWKLRGSKYVQSRLGTCFQDIKNDLLNGLKVLFIGTPCQVAGLKRYLATDYFNLFTVDLICHGVPPMHLLKDSLPKEAQALCANTMEFRVCSKYHFSLKNGISVVYSRPLWNDLFLKTFFTALTFRDSCYTCPYAKAKRIGDLTLGDFWGIKDVNMLQKMKEGVSLVLINNKKGISLFNEIRKSLQYCERDLNEATKCNKQLQFPASKSWRTILFHKLYPHFGFKTAASISLWEIVLKNKLMHLFQR